MNENQLKSRKLKKIMKIPHFYPLCGAYWYPAYAEDILNKALARLKEFYKKAQGGALLQKSTQIPPVKFNSYKKNAGACMH